MRWILLWMLPVLLAAHNVEFERWPSGETLLTFLDKQQLPQSVYYELDKEDQKLTEEIQSGVNYQIVRDRMGKIEQVLIPVNDELQLHITCNYETSDANTTAASCALSPIPIISETHREAFTVTIQNSPYNDIFEATGSRALATLFVSGFKNSLNFRRDLRRGDHLVMIYDQKYRFGRPFSLPELVAAMIEMRGKKHYVYRHSDGRFYDEKGAQVEGFLLSRPVNNARISSPFTKRRFHPILKRYRAHLGIDYAARSGTPVKAAGSGKVITAGYNRGYGKVIKIRHGDGYMTLYAHLKSFRRGIKRGTNVKKGQVIGYVGSTGLSTGPHLHFGLYKNGRAINPASVVQVTTKKLYGKERKAFLKNKKRYDAQIAQHLEKETKPHHQGSYQYVYQLDENFQKKAL
jgi:murein DD-endopeptidase MepM/ murein hydrolase activator NlpD